MYCPNCGKQTVESKQPSTQKAYYGFTNQNDCKECLASFENYDDGSKKREERDKERKERYEMYLQIKEQYLQLKEEFEGADGKLPNNNLQ